MAVIAQTARAGIFDAVRTILSASDTLTYVANSSQILEVANNTAGSLTLNIKGSAPSAAFPVAGAGNTTISLVAGKDVIIAANKTFQINLDSIAAYLAGTGTVTVTGAATAIATLVA